MQAQGAEEAIAQAAQQGHWVHLTNVDLALEWLQQQLPATLQRVLGDQQAQQPGFQLWLSTSSTDVLPPAVVDSCHVVAVEALQVWIHSSCLCMSFNALACCCLRSQQKSQQMAPQAAPLLEQGHHRKRRSFQPALACDADWTAESCEHLQTCAVPILQGIKANMESLLAEARASKEPLPTRHALAYPRVCFALAFLHSTLLTAHQDGHLSTAMHASDFMVGREAVL